MNIIGISIIINYITITNRRPSAQILSDICPRKYCGCVAENRGDLRRLHVTMQNGQQVLRRFAETTNPRQTAQNIRIDVYICMYVCMYTYIYIYIYIYTCLHITMYMYTHIYSYTHIHIYIYIYISIIINVRILARKLPYVSVFRSGLPEPTHVSVQGPVPMTYIYIYIYIYICIYFVTVCRSGLPELNNHAHNWNIKLNLNLMNSLNRASPANL